MKSMTGVAISPKISIRTLNSRGLEIKLRLGREYWEIESAIKALIQKTIVRGTVELQLEHHPAATHQDPTKILENRLNPIVSGAVKFCRDHNLGTPNLRDIVAWKNLEETFFPTPTIDVLGELPDLLSKLDSVRKNEGAKTQAFILNKIQFLTQRLEHVSLELPKIREHLKNKFQDRIKELKELPQDRIFHEIALMLEKADVSEEISRIGMHLEEFKKLCLLDKEPVGRKLEFLAQELHREWTTLGNKTADPTLQHQILEAKLAVDALREQSANVE